MKSYIKLCCMFIAFFIAASTLKAQINPLDKLKNKTTDRVDSKVDEGIDKGLDKVEGVFKKKDKTDKKSEEDTNNGDSNDKSGSGKNSGNSGVKDGSPLTSYTKYDFIPGSELLLYEDFSQDAVGDFPALWTTDGSGEVRTLNNYPGKWLYMSSKENVYCLMKNLSLPENFILEFDVIPTPPEDDENHASFYMTFFNTNEDYLQDGLVPGTEGFHIACNTDEWNVSGYKDAAYMVESESNIAPVKMNSLNHIIVWVQKRRIRIYHEGQKVLDGTSALPEGGKYNRFRFSMWGCQGHPYVSNIKITTAAPDMRSKLLTEGKLVSYGLYFDSGSDKLKAESYGTLKEIATVLTENPTVKIKIVGHTDSDGADAANLELSKKRAIAVKEALNKDFSIDNSRIETDGKGESEPIAPNTTAEGKAKNRRVEFIKL